MYASATQPAYAAEIRMTTLQLVLPITALAAQPCSNIYCFSAKPTHAINFHLHLSTSLSSLSYSHSQTLSSNTTSNTRHRFELSCTALRDQTQTTNAKKKLYVYNLPCSLSAADIKNLFGQCGTVTDVEIIKNKNGGLSGFAFVTMASGDEAQAAIDKFHSHEISGRIIKAELARRFKKPRPPGPPSGEARHKIYASNLAWKVRASHLREFFTENFKKPVSASVVFDSSSGRCAGYGFVSFDTKEEAEDSISALDGKELMGRRLHLKISQKTIEDAESDKDEEQGHDDQLEESGAN